MNEWLLSHQGSPQWMLEKFLLENFTVRHLRSSFPPHLNMIQFIRHHQLNILHIYKVRSRAVKNMYSQDSSVGKESACNAGDLSSILRLGRCPGEGIGYPLQYSGLENSMEYIVHGITESQTRLSDFHFSFHKNINCDMQAIWVLEPNHTEHFSVSQTWTMFLIMQSDAFSFLPHFSETMCFCQISIYCLGLFSSPKQSRPIQLPIRK